MLSEAPATARPDLPPRAGVALLTLRLRAALHDAESAETTTIRPDHGAAREQLRARLAPLIEARRVELDNSLADVIAEADATVAAAERAAAVMIAQSTRRDAPSAPSRVADSALFTLSPAAMPPTTATAAARVLPRAHEVADPRAVEASVTSIAAAVGSATAVVLARPAVAVASASEATVAITAAQMASSPAADAPAQSAPAASTTVVIDAEAFARVFATVFATVLDERFATLGSVAGSRQALALAVAPVPVVKQSFWTHARHPDVLLMGLATVIVLVVMAAWLA